MTSKSVFQIQNIDTAASALAQVQHAKANELAGDYVSLILRIIDGTRSMNRFQQELIEAAKYNVDALISSKAADEILLSTWVFNSRIGFSVINGFVPLQDVTHLDSSSYQPDGMTNLYDTVFAALDDPNVGIKAYAKSLRDSGIRVKLTVLVLSDGEDNDSVINPQKIKDLTTAAEGEYYVFMAFGKGYAQMAADAMGFPNVKEYSASGSEWRKLMGEFSKSQVRASQTTIAPNSFLS